MRPNYFYQILFVSCLSSVGVSAQNSANEPILISGTKSTYTYSQQTVRKEVSDFLKWVLLDGQKYNHAEGFLNLDQQDLEEQLNQLNGKFLSLK